MLIPPPPPPSPRTNVRTLYSKHTIITIVRQPTQPIHLHSMLAVSNVYRHVYVNITAGRSVTEVERQELGHTLTYFKGNLPIFVKPSYI